MYFDISKASDVYNAYGTVEFAYRKPLQNCQYNVLFTRT